MRDLLPNQEREKIVEMLKENGLAKVATLAKIFKVIDVTMRRDPERLEKSELVKRGRWGFPEDIKNKMINFALLKQDNLKQKDLIDHPPKN